MYVVWENHYFVYDAQYFCVICNNIVGWHIVDVFKTIRLHSTLFEIWKSFSLSFFPPKKILALLITIRLKTKMNLISYWHFQDMKRKVCRNEDNEKYEAQILMKILTKCYFTTKFAYD
mgnify:CR=1 FL=1